jgi:hypothetical protein
LVDGHWSGLSIGHWSEWTDWSLVIDTMVQTMLI